MRMSVSVYVWLLFLPFCWSQHNKLIAFASQNLRNKTPNNRILSFSTPRPPPSPYLSYFICAAWQFLYGSQTIPNSYRYVFCAQWIHFNGFRKYPFRLNVAEFFMMRIVHIYLYTIHHSISSYSRFPRMKEMYSGNWIKRERAKEKNRESIKQSISMSYHLLE